MSLTVFTTGGKATVPGVDFYIDWPDSGDTPGLAILDKPEQDNTAKTIAYYAPGYWLGVLVDEARTEKSVPTAREIADRYAGVRQGDKR